MSPTVFRHKGYRFYFFSREELRMHVHVAGSDGEAKYWLEPVIEQADSSGMNAIQLREIRQFIEQHRNEIIDAWHAYFTR